MDLIKILIVDDHDLIVDGLKSMLQTVENFDVVGEAYDGEEAVLKAVELQPHVIIMDISMPKISGLEASERILQKLTDVKIIVLSQHEDKEYITRILEIGGVGYLSKNSKKSEFINAINTVVEGGNYFSKKISDIMIGDFVNSKSTEEKPVNVHLTAREIEIIKYIANEYSNQRIADELCISLRTVETHRRNVMQKLNVKSAVSLIKYAAQNNIINL